MKCKRGLKILSILAFLSSVIWLIADVLMIGFIPNIDKYIKFSKLAFLDPKLSILMLEASSTRLLISCLLVTFIIPILILTLELTKYILKNLETKLSKLSYIFFVISMSLSALGHASFFYVGEMTKLIYETKSFDSIEMIRTTNLFMSVIYIICIPAMLIGISAWLLLSIEIYRDNSLLPKKSLILSPVITIPIILLIFKIIPKGTIHIFEGSTFALASSIFYAYVMYFLLKEKDQKLK